MVRPEPSPPSAAQREDRLTLQLAQAGGFTMVEMLIALTIGLVLVAASLSFAITTFQGAEGNKVREEVYRNARFIGMSLQRDVQTAGVGIESEVDFGTLNVFNDTVVVMAVPWEPTLAPAHPIDPPAGASNPMSAADLTAMCGTECIDLEYDAGGSFDFAPGDLARLQVNSSRRLILVTAVTDEGTGFELDWLDVSEILHYPAGLSGGLGLDPSQTTVQKLHPIVYYVDNDILYRAQSFDVSGVLQPSPMAYGVAAWDAWLIFTDLDEATNADVTDADVTNDFDDLLGVRIATTLSTNQPDIRVNDGNLFTNDYVWQIMPRNLAYERNR